MAKTNRQNITTVSLGSILSISMRALVLYAPSSNLSAQHFPKWVNTAKLLMLHLRKVRGFLAETEKGKQRQDMEITIITSIRLVILCKSGQKRRARECLKSLRKEKLNEHFMICLGFISFLCCSGFEFL